MPHSNALSVLIVDDSDVEERAKFDAINTSSLKLEFRHPRDVNQSDLDDANLVLVDYLLEDWLELSQFPIAVSPQNGLALIATLKSHVATNSQAPPKAFLLRSAKLNDLSHEYSTHHRLYILAQQNNLEWIFDKAADLSEQVSQLCSLAEAVSALPIHWPNDDINATRQILADWLGLPESVWQEAGWQDIEDAHPPLHSLSERRHGLRFLRWFLHRILPYPCFLWTEARLAARLRVSLASFEVAQKSGLAECFQAAKYTGQLHDFLGDRWWRSGCESILWDLTGGRSFDADTIVSALNDKCGGALQKLPIIQPVLSVDGNCQMGTEIIDVEKAVRLQPDDWPPYAESPWCLIDRVRENHHLHSLVLQADRDRLEFAPGEGANT